MKFKQSDVQNQRIERITTSHLVVGIDMAKETHVAQATNFRGIVLSNRHLAFKNTAEGFEKLKRWIGSLQQKHRLKSFIIGMEPTGHYWYNLANWLVDLGIHVVLVNPATTKRNKENRDNCQSKSDPKDALVIADVVSRGYYYEYSRQSASFQRLRVMMSDREFWVTNSVRLQNRIVRWLDIRFPEYASVFKKWTGIRSLATLKEFPSPLDLRGLSTAEIITGWRKHMQRAGGCSGIQKAAELLSKANRSVGDVTSLREAKQDLVRLIEEYERIESHLEQIEKEVAMLLEDIPIAGQMRSVKGLGTIYIAAILSGAGDLAQYVHGRQLLRKAGLNLAESMSGKRKGEVILSKRGSAVLRKYMYLATLTLIGVNPIFRQLHENNLKVKHMSKQKSILKLLGKLARILIGMVHSGESFTPEKTVHTSVQAA
ncbi:IS110 family transposase [Paenibacillus mucilaginosus]|uniref:Transposase IS116/IS110/IS902 family protein n=1 Tax=Paenibacillus mucilaginosus (strain KNP414) TaxID=1036673 RepID=F8F698_PAEMK|nr:IS110 family transposase [Paenibacillus mucilaginosus]AEI42372.1 transposase IS116/IS110/IS902 family protein [Paenibacillus mucilaginosus KNP414]AEI44453.1 transposase IS116/IS110/IS902 family protein [Paenibacillus mucilaginosus KNP414]MCG7218188.1 IS110 family transposase [Paenibacillus mucilaginosus]WDM28835.1 IS110 family transposase [Paenibacillus mucilaginosus]